MGEPGADDLQATADRIAAGKDGIAVPDALVEEREEGPKPEERSLYAQILNMSVSERLKLALRGNKNARMILARDPTKVIRRFVLDNPRITDTEVVSITKNRSADSELLRKIADTREWMRNYQVRVGLAMNPKTPLPIALRQVPTLTERDLRTIARSKNVPGGVAAQARRLLLTKGPA